MVVADRFRITDTLREVWRPLTALFLLDTLVTIAYVGLGWTWIVPAGLPLPLLGTGLAVFLGVRNNTAYARWWEARTLWGAVLNNSRSYARGLTLLMVAPEAEPLRRSLVRHQIAWAHALRCFMRREDPKGEIAPFLPPDTLDRVVAAANPPFAIQREIAELLLKARRNAWLDGIEASALNGTLSSLTDAQGGLERIRNTPMPQQYAAFSRVFVTAYCLLLPFGIVPDLNILTPLGSAVLGFVFLALDESGRHLEDPFRRSIYDVPMSAITRTVEIDLRQSLDDVDVPPPLRPVRGVLR
jgi:putative membrane protein